MINYEVVISEQADADLRGIYEYIAVGLSSVDNAIAQLDRLEKNIMELEYFPERHRLYEKSPWFERGLRVMPVDNYLVFYISDKNKAIVTVVRIMYSGRNIDEQFGNY